ncbi:DUF4180 domain-containing protein [Actinokineospora sp. HUAS TT18]|uniref:DUF4180 domain-containing protein n=1 Tax=Actinokineospora sp. HUAS TT18 TaxID=3447451 RepID=UPI003F522C2B
MPDVVQERAGTQVMVCDPDGPPITTEEDALQLISAVFHGAEVVAVPASRLGDSFFALETRFAGEVMQKFVNYRVRLAVVGDISHHLERSSALRALVHESNRSNHVWFVPDLDALDTKLSATKP